MSAAEDEGTRQLLLFLLIFSLFPSADLEPAFLKSIETFVAGKGDSFARDKDRNFYMNAVGSHFHLRFVLDSASLLPRNPLQF